MTKDFDLKIIKEGSRRQIDFKNNTSGFVEVVFTVDGREVGSGETFSGRTRGYCYPPHHHKHLRKIALPSNRSGIIQAYVYRGQGELVQDDFDVPPFIRFKLNERKSRNEKINIQELVNSADKKARFQRMSNNPSVVLEIPY